MDDCSPFEFSGTTNDVILKLENYAIILMQWFKNNYMQLNPGKCHMILSDNDHNLTISLGNKLRPNPDKCHMILSDNDHNLTISLGNKLRPNPDKCHMILSDNDHNLTISLGNELVPNSE